MPRHVTPRHVTTITITTSTYSYYYYYQSPSHTRNRFGLPRGRLDRPDRAAPSPRSPPGGRLDGPAQATARQPAASRGRAMASWDGTHKCLGLDGLGTSFCNTCSTLGSHKGAWGRFQAVGWQICKSCIKSEDGVCYTYSSIGISICIIVSAPVPVPLPLPVSSRSCRRLQASSTGARRLACSQWAKEDEEQWPKEDEEKK